MKLLMGTKVQFKMYLDDDLVERLKKAADKCGKNSGQEVVEEILAVYLPVWTSVNESMRRAVDFQTKTFMEHITELPSERQKPVSGRPLALTSKSKIPHKIAKNTTQDKRKTG